MNKKIKVLKKGSNSRIDLACGQNKAASDLIGIDIGGTPDIFYDLEQYPWKFAEDESVSEIFVSHYIEHTKHIEKFMDECYRILITGGKINIVAPYYTSMRCWQDYTHVRAVSEATFLYFNAAWREQNKLTHGAYNIKSDFDYTYGYNLNASFQTKSREVQDFAIKHYNNVVDDIVVNLTKK